MRATFLRAMLKEEAVLAIRLAQPAVFAVLAVAVATKGVHADEPVIEPLRGRLVTNPTRHLDFVPSSVGPFVPRGGATLYSRETSANFSAFPPGAGGSPAGSGTQPDIYFDDIPIPAVRLAVGGVTSALIDVCQVSWGVRQFANAPAVDVVLYWASIASSHTATDTDIDTPPHLIGTVHLPANTDGSLVPAVIGDGVNPIPGMMDIPLNMNYASNGTAASFGTFALGVALVDPATGQAVSTPSTFFGLRLTSGPDVNLNSFWIYDTDLNATTNPPGPETGPWAFSGANPPAAFHITVKGVPKVMTTPMACCVSTANVTQCFVAANSANCAQANGTVVAGQTTCNVPCATIVCCNLVTGVCTVEVGVASCQPQTGVLVAGQTSCVADPCQHLPPPGNDECTAAVAGSQYELSSGRPILVDQSLVGATASAGYSTGIGNCTFASGDVWYRLTLTQAQSSAQHLVVAAPAPSAGGYILQPLSLAVFDGATGCPNATGGLPLACVDFANPSYVTFTGTGSTVYYIRVAYFSPGTTRFGIAVGSLEPGAGTPHSPPGYQPPAPPTGQHNLILVTHGCCTSQSVFDSFWESFRASIQFSGIGSDWAVLSYNWTSDSGAYHALGRAWAHGDALGPLLASQGYRHVHLIGHSAGTRLIAQAAARIKDWATQHGQTITVQTTYLDAFGVWDIDSNYGMNADWSDHYSSKQRVVCGDLVTGPFTELQLQNSFNLDVSRLDPAYTPQCLSRHEWPRCYYKFTVDSEQVTDCGHVTQTTTIPFGFALSYERWPNAGDFVGWKNARSSATSQYREGTVCEVLGSCRVPASEIRAIATSHNDPVSTPVFSSSVAAVMVSPNTLNMTTQPIGAASVGPAWANVPITTPSTSNYVSFTMGFTCVSGAAGLMSLYVDGVEAGIVDEPYARPGMQPYSMLLPADLPPGEHVIGIRLDPQNALATTITIRDLDTGYAQFVICPADFDGSGMLAVADIFAFLNAWFAGDPRTDFDRVNGLQVQDIFAFLNAWFAGCP